MHCNMKARKKKYAVGGKLTPKQKKLDKNKDGKISGQDFKMMKKGGKLYKDGGKVSKLLKGLEGMPDSKGRKVMSLSERAMAPYKAGAKQFTKAANKFMEDMTGKRRPQK
jgi:hypothetical protein